LPYEKKKLSIAKNFANYSYLIQSAIDYELCLRVDVLDGNSFSIFPILIALERTQLNDQIRR
jgi:hypothetical protein